MFAKINKVLLLFLIFSLFLLGVPAVLATGFPLVCMAETPLISSVDELTEAIANAKEGDTVLVDDITFKQMPMGMIAVSKDIIIKSGKATNAVFSNATFAINGGLTDLSTLSVRFENIDFRGDRSGIPLDPNEPPEIGSILPNIMKTMCAAIFNQNVDATYDGCTFEGYHYGYGGVFNAIYSSNENKNNTLDLTLNDCSFRNNAGKYGGSIYISGYNNNVSLDARHCSFEANAAATGGAIWAEYANVHLLDCDVVNNQFLNATVSTPNGGALALYNCSAELDGCLIANNTSGGKGAGVYCEISPFKTMVMENCTVIGNTAVNDEGIFVALSETNYDTAALAHIYFSSIFGKQDLTENVKLFGCLNSYEAAEKVEPSEENGYCLTMVPNGVQVSEEAKHVSLPTGEYPIPQEEIAKIAFGKFSNSLGKLQVGDNYKKEATVEIVKTPRDIETITVRYGDKLSLKIPERKGYSFAGWEQPKGTSIENTLFIGGELPEGSITARWHFVLAENLYVIWVPIVGVVALGAVIFYLSKKKKVQTASPIAVSISEGNKVQPMPAIIKAWFTKEEIDTIMRTLPRVQTLTSREIEVLVESLQGKKQKEIAYDLGIEITTVKDFYRKINNKLGFENKEELLKKCSELVAKENE